MFKLSHQFIFCFSILGQSDQKQKKISCPVYLLFTEKANFLLVNKEHISQLKLVLRSWKKVNKQDSWFFCFWSLRPNNEKWIDEIHSTFVLQERHKYLVLEYDFHIFDKTGPIQWDLKNNKHL